MRSLFTLAALAVSTMVFAQGSNGLVGHWSFNGNTNDISGNGLNGTTIGTSNVAGYNGLPNNALSFDGTTSYVSIADNALLDIDSFSICALIRPTGLYTGTCQGNSVLWRGNHNDPHLYSLYFTDNPYDAGNCPAADTNKYNFAVEAHGNSVEPIAAFHDTGSYIHTGAWYCVVSTYDNDTIKIYVDGSLVAKSYWPGQFMPGTDDMLIGATQLLNYPYHFQGIMDDVRLYRRALSVSEVNTYCDSATQIPTAINVAKASQFSFGPNPANDKIHIEAPAATKLYSVAILNSVCQVMQYFGDLSGAADVDVSRLPAGLYIIRFMHEGSIRTEKFVKE
jgi:hypothetical protein